MIALKAQQACQVDAGKVGSSGDTDGGVGRHQILLGDPDIWAPFQERRWQSRRDRRLLLLRQRAAAGNGSRASAKQKADLVLGLLNTLLDSRNGLCSGVDQLLALPNL